MSCVEAASFAVISDLHLGRAGASTACAVPAHELVGFLRALLDSHALLVANGDIYDLERGTVPFAFARELITVRRDNAAVAAALDHPRVVSTVGNHDEHLARHGVARSLDVVTPAGVFRCEHGHRFNPWIKRNAAFTSAVTWASGRVSGRALKPLWAALRSGERALSGPNSVSRIEARALASIREDPRYVGIVIGHTHQAQLLHAHDRVLVNPGDCMHEPRYVSVNPSAGCIEFGVFREGALTPVAQHDL